MSARPDAYIGGYLNLGQLWTVKNALRPLLPNEVEACFEPELFWLSLRRHPQLVTYLFQLGYS